MSINTNEIKTEEAAGTPTAVSTERFLTFSSDGLTIGISTNYVTEIITNHSITELPLVPNYVQGIINLRGQIIPIIDIRLRMGKASIPYTNHTCIIVLNIDSIHIGIVVDMVQQVIDIDKSLISAMPVEDQQELIDGMVSLEDHSVLLFLNCEQLVHAY